MDVERFFEVNDAAGVLMLPSAPVVTGVGGGGGCAHRASRASILLAGSTGMVRFGAAEPSATIFLKYSISADQRPPLPLF